MSAIFLLPGRLTYWPRKYTTRVDSHVDNSHQVWSWYVHTLLSYCVFVCWYVTWSCDLLTLNNCSAWLVTLPTLPIRSWFIRYNVSRWLPLTIRARPLRMQQVTWPMIRGQKQIHFWIPRPRFAYSLCNFGGSTMKVIKVIWRCHKCLIAVVLVDVDLP